MADYWKMYKEMKFTFNKNNNDLHSKIQLTKCQGVSKANDSYSTRLIVFVH